MGPKRQWIWRPALASGPDKGGQSSWHGGGQSSWRGGGGADLEAAAVLGRGRREEARRAHDLDAAGLGRGGVALGNRGSKLGKDGLEREREALSGERRGEIRTREIERGAEGGRST